MWQIDRMSELSIEGSTFFSRSGETFERVLSVRLLLQALKPIKIPSFPG